MSQNISIATLDELAAFLERERLQMRAGVHGGRWWVSLSKATDHGLIIAVYPGKGASMLEAIVDAAKVMYERRQARPSSFLEG